MVGVKADANELMVLEAVHHFVEVLDQYFGSVCELDIIFNFHRVCAGVRVCVCVADWSLDMATHCCPSASHSGTSLA